MYTGVDWGGHKIEAIALGETRTALARLRVNTPRGDYDGCLTAIADHVREVEQKAGSTGSWASACRARSIRGPRIANGSSSTWLNGRQVEADLRAVLEREIRTAHGPRRLLLRGFRGARRRGQHELIGDRPFDIEHVTNRPSISFAGAIDCA
jgi:predicted NBD/HSP70 family sugar kinase